MSSVMTIIASSLFAFLAISTTVTNFKSRASDEAEGKNTCDVCDCYGPTEYGTMVNCSSRNLTQIPSNMPEDVFQLYLNFNEITDMEISLFSNLKWLQYLDISFNKLKKVDEKIFASCSKLQILHINSNQLTALPGYFLTANTILKVLDVSDNKLYTLPQNLLASNLEINTVNFSSNAISEIPPTLFDICAIITGIDISHNRIEKLPRNVFAAARNLQELTIAKNRLGELPRNIFANNKELSYVDVSDNRLMTVSGDIFTPTKLKVINLSKNRLQSVPVNLLENQHLLWVVDISENCIEELSENSFSTNNGLQRLILSNNGLQELPERLFSSNAELKQLDISYNLLRRLPDDIFVSTEKLEMLNLKNNILQFIPAKLFTQTQNLTYLYLTGNNLTSLPNTFLYSVPFLDSLHIDDNSVSEISETIFAVSRNLRELSMSKTELNFLPPLLFENTTNLQRLFLDGNNFVWLPDGLFANLPKLEVLNIDSTSLQSLPGSLFEATTFLNSLMCRENDLTVILDSVFAKTAKLNQVSFMRSYLNSIPGRLFENVTEMMDTDFSRNNISNIEGNLFSEVLLTRSLDLSYNQLEELPLGLFNSYRRSHNLLYLFLQRNHITYLRRNLFRGLPNLKTLCLYDNQIQLIENGVFATAGVKIYLFSNRLRAFSYDSFTSNGDTEIHLYGNNITTVSGNTTRILPVNSVLYINCDLLRGVDGAKVQMSCVGPMYAPKFVLSSEDLIENYIAAILKFEGFNCTLIADKKYYICTICPQGTYSNGLNECVLCPKGGFYQDKIGMTADSSDQMNCKECSNGTYVKNGGGTSQGDCVVCPDGTEKRKLAGFRACFCSDGFARRDRFGECYPCKQQGLRCTGQDFQSVEPGYYWNWSFPNADVADYNAFVENLLDKTMFYDNHTYYRKEIPRVHKCPRPASCASNYSQNRSIETTCNAGYKGWLCSKCDSGFHLIFNMCFHCPDPEFILLEVLVVLCFCFTLGYIIFWKYNKEINDHSERRAADKFVSRMKIVLGYYQVVGEYVSSFNDVGLLGAAHIVGEIISVLRMNILKFFMRPQCFIEGFTINPKSEFIISMSALCAFMTFPFVLYLITSAFVKLKYPTKYLLSNSRTKTLSFVVVLLFITYPPICTSVFQLYPGACQTFCLDLHDTNCFTVLRSDYNVNCDDYLISYQVFAVMASIGYVLAFPLILLYNLKKYCSKPREMKGGEHMAKKRNIQMEESTAILSGDSGNRHLPLCFKFLCENYKPQFWYWEIMELARKVSQTVLITLLGPDEKLTVLLTIGISVLFLTLHARCRPMKTVREQHLQMFSLTAILTNVVFIAVEIPEKYKGVLSWVLVFLNIFILFLIILEAFLVVIVRIKNGLLNSKGKTNFGALRPSQLSAKMDKGDATRSHTSSSEQNNLS